MPASAEMTPTSRPTPKAPSISATGLLPSFEKELSLPLPMH